MCFAPSKFCLETFAGRLRVVLSTLFSPFRVYYIMQIIDLSILLRERLTDVFQVLCGRL